MRSFPFDQLSDAPLIVDASYVGGRAGNAGDDPFPKLLGVSNQGGFRYRGSLNALQLVVLTSSLTDPEWPDRLDQDTGVFTYYGDNKKPGRDLHDTPRYGNSLLSRVFALAHGTVEERLRVPPIFVFGNAGDWRDAIFLGLAVPGTADLHGSEDLVAIWKSIRGRRFQNYRARFTVLDVPVVPRNWLQDIKSGIADSPNAPAAWRAWRAGGQARALAARRSVEHRSKGEQLPGNAEGRAILDLIISHFATRPHSFEGCAADLTRMLLPDTTALDLTRPSRDGGRDGIGRLRIGREPTAIDVEFALEAKCYAVNNSVGVREMARLLSRLRHRQFGVLVTTSFLDSQAYREIKEDDHPIIVVSGRDVVEILRGNGLGDRERVARWLLQDFPPVHGSVHSHGL